MKPTPPSRSNAPSSPYQVKGQLGINSKNVIKRENLSVGGGFNFEKVDIICAFHGQYASVTKLVGSIYRNTRRPFLLTLVDDASLNNKFVESLNDKTNINCLRTDVQVGFGGALKIGYENTNFPWIVFLHSDCYIDDPDWLNKMGNSMLELKGQGVKMISATIDNPGDADGIPSELKCSYRQVEYTDAKGQKQLMSVPQIDENTKDVILKEEEHLPLICTLCHRDLFHHIKGFVKEYPYAFYEDVELAYRMRHHGFKQAICKKAFVKHAGLTTLRTLWRTKEGVKKAMDMNYYRCIEDIKSLKK